MKIILTVFIVAFFGLSLISLGVSLYNGGDPSFSKSCRSASWMAFLIGFILLYLRFVLI